MKNLSDWQEFFTKGHLYYRSGVDINCSIFGFHDGKLQILLVKSKFLLEWQLPLGPAKKDESLEKAAERTSYEYTGIPNLFLKQFHAQDKPVLVPKEGQLNYIQEVANIKIDKDSWIFGDRVTIGFYAITDIVNSQPEPDILSSQCRWFAVDELPNLNKADMDMLTEALITIRIHLYHFPVGKSLLQQKFTLKEIKQFYEIMSGKQLNPTNFTNKLISLGIIIKLDEKKPIGGHRSPSYYKFDNKTYQEALEKGLVLA